MMILKNQIIEKNKPKSINVRKKEQKENIAKY